ncbi:MAG: hypothetical protein ABDH49_02125 [Candidatus Hydrothermales bacterium]
MISLIIFSFYTLNFYFENESKFERLSKPVNWELNFYRAHLELKFFRSSEIMNTYLSYWMENTFQRSKLLYLQGHVEFYKPFFLVFFAREDRHFFESPLLFVISPERIRDDDFGAKSEGARLNLKLLKNFEISHLFSKSKRTEISDINISSFKLRKFGETQIIYANKRNFHENKIYELYEIFLRFGILQGFLTLEYSNILKGNAIASELSNIYLGPFRFVLSYYAIDDSFRTPFSNRFSNIGKEWGKRGLKGEINFFFPYKSITITEKFDFYRTRNLFGKYYEKPFNFLFSQSEIYIEFINGYSFKSFYEIVDEIRETWRNLFFELKKEETNYLLKLQVKIKDIGVYNSPYSIGERVLLGIEGKINLPRNFFFYFRAAQGKNRFETWESAFLQLGYVLHGREIYLEYGEGYATDSDLVNDIDFSDSQFQRIYDIIRLRVKIWF